MDSSFSLIKNTYENFIIGMEYTHPDGERHFGLVTRNKNYIDGDIQPEEDNNYVVYDLITKNGLELQ